VGGGSAQVVGWIGSCGYGIALAAPRLDQRFVKLPHLALQPAAFEPLVPSVRSAASIRQYSHTTA
jgi:hypothetical protein